MPKKSKNLRSSSRNNKKSFSKKKGMVRKVGGMRVKGKKTGKRNKTKDKKTRKSKYMKKRKGGMQQVLPIIPNFLYRCLSNSKPNGPNSSNKKNYAELLNKIENGTFSNFNNFFPELFEKKQTLYDWIFNGSRKENYGPCISTAKNEQELKQHTFCENTYMVVRINIAGLNLELGTNEHVKKTIFCPGNMVFYPHRPRTSRWDINIEENPITWVFDIPTLSQALLTEIGTHKMTSNYKGNVMSGPVRVITASKTVEEVVLVSNEIGLERVFIGDNIFGIANNYTISLANPIVKQRVIEYIQRQEQQGINYLPEMVHGQTMRSMDLD